MSKLRIFTTSVDPKSPGSLQLLNITVDTQGGAIDPAILNYTLNKWLKLFTIQVFGVALTERTLTLLAYVPNKTLSWQAAHKRCWDFDCEQLKRPQCSSRNYRRHLWNGRKLNDLSFFMSLFTRDLGERHKHIPEDVTPELKQVKRILFTGRFNSKTVSHDALPHFFNQKQKDKIRMECQKAGFKTPADFLATSQQHVSTHGIGKQDFLRSLEAKCDNVIQKRCGYKKSPKLERPDLPEDCNYKTILQPKIVPLKASTWVKRAVELGAPPEEAEENLECTALEAIHDGVKELLKEDRRNIAKGFVDYLSLRRSEEMMTLFSCELPEWAILTLMDGMLRVYFWYDYRRELAKKAKQILENRMT